MNTREKFLEYRKLKKSGYTHDMLKEHFGDDIYHSGIYNRNPSKFSFLKKFNEINPIELKSWLENGFLYKNKMD